MWRARNVSTSLVAISVFLLTLCCSGRADCQDVPKTADCPPGQHSELGGVRARRELRSQLRGTSPDAGDVR